MTPGTRLGPYEVTALIGVGGMGEVYRATDTKLKREVAVKVLPPTLAGDRDRLARFQREAEVLASLSHPNIGGIHGLEESGGVTALVLELVEGPTLADRIAHGPIPMADALIIGRQIADALDAAHEKGIVHRDLKPANIKTTPGGVVKVLDFGLARATSGDTAPDLTHSPTATFGGTREGVILGTPAYMSPEQARGQAVDKRTDIWAFGCVLYEMLTGRAAFARSTTSDTLAAILGSEPEWEVLPRATPPAIRRLVQRCLKKGATQRLRDIADAGMAIDDELKGPEASTSENDKGAAVAAVARWRSAALALGAVALTAGAVAVWNSSRDTDTRLNAIAAAFAIHLQPGQQLPIDKGLPAVIAISRDGQQIVFATRDRGGDRLCLRRRDALDAAPIPGTEGAIGPFFSPDGQWIGFAAGGVLRVVSLAGGAPRAVADAANFEGGSWGPGDSIIYAPRWGSGLFRVSAHGGKPEPVTPGEEFYKSPHVLPDGEAVLSSVHRDGMWVIDVVEFSTGGRRALVEGRNPTYVPSGHIVFARDNTLFAIPFDVVRRVVTGAAVPLIDGVRSDGNDTHFAVADDGTLVYVPDVVSDSTLVWFDRQGHSRPLDAEPHRYSHPRISPDGTRVVVSVDRESGGAEIWIYDAQRGAHAQLGASGEVSRPIWTADGKRITFQREGDLYSAPADDSGEPRLLLKRDDAQLVLRREDQLTTIFPLDWSSDGHVLVFSAPAPTTNRDVWTLRGNIATPFLITPRDERAAMFSPDGRWIVYAAKETGREEQIYVQPYPGPGGREVISSGGGIEPVWSPTGREIFYRSVDGTQVMSVSVRTEPSFAAGTPRILFAGRFADLGGSYWSNYDVSRDGQSFLLLQAEGTSIPRLNVVLNWQAAITPR